MAKRTNETTADSLTSILDLVERRINAARGRLDEVSSEVRERTDELLDAIANRAEDLRRTIEDIEPEDRMYAASGLLGLLDSIDMDLDAMPHDTADRFDRLERRARSWLGSLENVRVQAALGRMETRDEVDSLADRGRHAWHRAVQNVSDAGEDIEHATSDLGAVVGDIRDMVRHLLRTDPPSGS